MVDALTELRWRHRVREKGGRAERMRKDRGGWWTGREDEEGSRWLVDGKRG
jgi:hypothetical protein